MVSAGTKSIEKQARKLARYHRKVSPSIKEIYLFPSDREIRLVELDPITPASEIVAPFYFAPDPADGITYWLAIAMIRPDEKRRLSPPEDWGDWNDAKRI